MADSLFNQALLHAPPHFALTKFKLDWNDLRYCFAKRMMNTQLFTQYFDRIRYWNWVWISEHMQLDESFIYRYCRHIDWERISRHQRLTTEIVTKFETDISWAGLSSNPHLTIDILTNFATRLDWNQVCKTIVLDEVHIEQFLRYIDWYELSLKSPLSETFIRRHQDKVNWPRITAHQTLTDTFIDEFTDRVDWDYISRHRPMVPTYIEQHAKDVDWGLISDGQTLDERFILAHRTQLDWEEIAFRQPISEEFFEKYVPTNIARTPAIWAAFVAGRRLSLAFIRRNIANLPAHELVLYQPLTLDEVREFAAHLDWTQLSQVHPFTIPETGEIDEDFIREFADRINWPRLVRTHILPVRLLVDFCTRFAHTDVHQDIPLDILRTNPELVHSEWITQNCPLTAEYLRAAHPFIRWPTLIARHLPEDIMLEFAGDLDLAQAPVWQSPMSPDWIAIHARTGRRWAGVADVDPRWWPLYGTPNNITRLLSPSDEFFLTYRDQALADPEFPVMNDTHILLKTFAAARQLCNPRLVTRIQFAIALNELNVPSTWDFLETLDPTDMKWARIVRNRRLSEAFLRRFQHKVSWNRVNSEVHSHQRPFSEQFVREFEMRLDFSIMPLPYDVSMAYIREFGRRHDWSRLTSTFQQWQMEQYMDRCDFQTAPYKPLTPAFIAQNYTFRVVAVTQPLAEAYICQHDMAKWAVLLSPNTKLSLSQKFMRRYKHVMPNAHWARVSNQTLSMPPAPPKRADVPITRAELSAYSLFKLAKGGFTYDPPTDLKLMDDAHFWTTFGLPPLAVHREIQTAQWSNTSIYVRLPPTFLDKYKDRVDWRAVSMYQVLSEEAIRQFKDYVIWPLISKHQKLSESFITEFADRVSWELVSPYSACF